jgi:hypothetical protein
MTLTKSVQGDEDEGSPFHHGAKPKAEALDENRKISGSPPGVPPPDIFSLQTERSEQNP